MILSSFSLSLCCLNWFLKKVWPKLNMKSSREELTKLRWKWSETNNCNIFTPHRYDITWQAQQLPTVFLEAKATSSASKASEFDRLNLENEVYKDIVYMNTSTSKNIPVVSISNLIVLARQRISDSPKPYTKQFFLLETSEEKNSRPNKYKK